MRYSIGRIWAILEAWGYNWATLYRGKINTGCWPSNLGESKNWDSEIFSRVLQDTVLRKIHWQSPSVTVNCRPILSSERASYNKNHECLMIVFMEGKDKLVTGPRWHQDGLAGWLTVHHKILLTLIFLSYVVDALKQILLVPEYYS